MKFAWVVGEGGLLGSEVKQQLRCPLFTPRARVAWSDPLPQLVENLRAFFEQLPPGSTWQIFWCAGAGVVGTSAEAMMAETSSLSGFLEALTPWGPGQLFVASSAGGTFGQCEDQPLTERSTCQPVSDYGKQKLRQEELVAQWSARHPQAQVLVGRFSNLYGSGQNTSKAQGLISHLSRSLVCHRPIRLYVPLDTIRDYLFVEDAARRVLAALDRASELRAKFIVKIFASEQSVSIAGLLAIFSRLARRQPRVIAAASPLTAQQPGRLQFKSVVLPDASPGTELVVGVQRVFREHLRQLQAGTLLLPAVEP